MKIAGKKIQGSNIEYAIIPRPSTIAEDGSVINNDVAFMARAVLDFSDFEKLCPPPQPPLSKRPGGESFQNVEAPAFKTANILWSVQKTNWIILESLKATEDLEWEKVIPEDPNTWGLYSEELTESGFNWREQELIREAVWKANALNDQKLEDAKKRFLASREVAPKS